MQNDEVFNKLQAYIASRFELDSEQITLDTTQSDLGIDSLLMVDLFMDVEEIFGVRIDIESGSLPRNPSIRDIVSIVQTSR